MKQILSVLISVLSFFSSQSQDTTNLAGLVITYQANSRTPVTFQNISGKTLDAKNIGQEPSFIFIETPSITAYSDAGNGQGYSYYRLRGMDQTRINTTLDGMPLNEPEDQGAYFSNYPDILNSISKIQFQRGVGTSRNGAASYAGSVALFSPDLSDSANTTFGVGYGSYNSLRVFGEHQSGIKNRKSFYVRASEEYTDGYKYHSSNHSQSIFMSGGLYYDKTTWKMNVMAGLQRNELAWLGVADSLIAKDRRTNANSNERDHFFQALLQLQNTWRPNRHSAVNSSIYYTALKGNYDFDVNNFLGIPSDGDMFNYAFRSGFLGFFTNYTLTLHRLKWTSGVNGNVYNRQHTGSDRFAGEEYRNTGYKNEISAFSKLEYSVNHFTVYADLQYRYTSFDYKGSVAFDKLDWQFVNPKAGISYSIDDQTTMYYSVGKMGREPTRNDMFGGNDNLAADSNGKAEIYNKDAEHVTDQELGVRFHKKSIIVDLNGYYMDFRNEIVLNGQIGPNGLVLTDKVKRSYRTGVELTVNYILKKHFTFTNNSSFNYSRINQQSANFTPILTPAWILNQEVAYHSGPYGISLSGRYQSRSYIDFANDAIVKGYVLANARAEYTRKGYQLAIHLNNIFSAKYMNSGYVESDGTRKYFVQAPANLYVSLKYSL